MYVHKGAIWSESTTIISSALYPLSSFFIWTLNFQIYFQNHIASFLNCLALNLYATSNIPLFLWTFDWQSQTHPYPHFTNPSSWLSFPSVYFEICFIYLESLCIPSMHEACYPTHNLNQVHLLREWSCLYLDQDLLWV